MFFRLLKVQRIIRDSEKASQRFTSKDFKFMHKKFLDLDRATPPQELDDFHVASRYNDEVEIVRLIHLSFLKNMLNEDICDFTKARRRQRFIIFIWRMYEVLVYSYLIYLTYLLFQKIFVN